ncbi:hypothetical protein DLAC_06173 [Tieghemostelium lacteum]|uniref:Uncharacterized protein n=1 Tax=Tieghemostelium lacteum TaxID=361077 RepID=A0A151ZHY4_TIELA|nr:hypothetical protein DLAC_06173 [Tieghemostelium lacteum]|eukprot:KYQ93480.1 hypothetical protein DLAC_06173 [Tieghemostelium lacteum]
MMNDVVDGHYGEILEDEYEYVISIGQCGEILEDESEISIGHYEILEDESEISTENKLNTDDEFLIANDLKTVIIRQRINRSTTSTILGITNKTKHLYNHHGIDNGYTCKVKERIPRRPLDRSYLKMIRASARMSSNFYFKRQLKAVEIIMTDTNTLDDPPTITDSSITQKENPNHALLQVDKTDTNFTVEEYSNFINQLW